MAKSPAKTSVQGLDGIPRTPETEAKLNALVWRVLDSPDGEKLLTYLKNITLNRMLPPTVTNEALRDLEGSRRLVMMLIARRDKFIFDDRLRKQQGRRGDALQPDMPKE